MIGVTLLFGSTRRLIPNCRFICACFYYVSFSTIIDWSFVHSVKTDENLELVNKRAWLKKIAVFLKIFLIAIQLFIFLKYLYQVETIHSIIKFAD